MKIMIDIGHPAHVHLFKNIIWELEKRGDTILVTARDKDVVLKLLDAYQIPYHAIGKKQTGIIALTREWIVREYKIYKIAKNFHPDIMLGLLNPATAHVAKLIGAKSIIFNDSEPEAIKYPIEEKLTVPFANRIITLASVNHDYGPKSIRINSYKELAYLHPNVFTPNPNVLEQAGLKKGDDYVLLRFVAWGASHDVGEGGFSLEEKRTLIHQLQQKVHVYISSELPLPKEFEQYRLPISPDKMHDFLYYAKLFISDSQTMTTEAALLATPAIRYNSFVGEKDMGNFRELEEKYGLIFNFRNGTDAINKAMELLKTPGLKEQWREKQKQLLSEKEEIIPKFIEIIEYDT